MDSDLNGTDLNTDAFRFFIDDIIIRSSLRDKWGQKTVVAVTEA